MGRDGAGLRRREAAQIREGRRGGFNKNFNFAEVRFEETPWYGRRCGPTGYSACTVARWRKKGTLDFFLNAQTPSVGFMWEHVFWLTKLLCTNAAASFFQILCIGKEEGAMNVGKIL